MIRWQDQEEKGGTLAVIELLAKAAQGQQSLTLESPQVLLLYELIGKFVDVLLDMPLPIAINLPRQGV